MHRPMNFLIKMIDFYKQMFNFVLTNNYNKLFITKYLNEF